MELIVSIIALIQGKGALVQASLLGPMLSNLLLVLGMCFFFGGWTRKEQSFNMTVHPDRGAKLIKAAQTSSSLLVVAIASLLIPAAFHASLGSSAVSENGVERISRATSVLLLVVYGTCLPTLIGI